jgi:hypothetical protein
MIFNAGNMLFYRVGKTIQFLKDKCSCNFSPSIAFINPTQIINSNICESLNILSAEFKKWLRSVYAELSQKLVGVLTQDFSLKYHLQSMKHFFLMGSSFVM